MSVILAAAIAVTGSVQFWDRHCEANGPCGIPAALSAKLPVAGEVQPPTGPGTLGQFHQALADGDRVVDFQIFWVAPPDGSTPYLVAQSRLTEAGRLLTECTQYADQNREIFFPIGMCSGFVPDESGSRQVGVTFYK